MISPVFTIVLERKLEVCATPKNGITSRRNTNNRLSNNDMNTNVQRRTYKNRVFKGLKCDFFIEKSISTHSNFAPLKETN